MYVHRLMKRMAVALVGMVVFVFTACWPTGFLTGTLAISLSANLTPARTIQPKLDLAVSSYTVKGSGPNDSSFATDNVTGSSFTKGSLIPGSWTVTVVAFNAAGTTIGSDQQTTVISAGQTDKLTMTVVPLSGNGTLSLSVSWPANSLTSPKVTASLTPQKGTATPLSFNVGSTSATYSGSQPEGYYSLSLKLTEGSALLVGTEDAVRILSDQTSSASYAYVPGSASITIDANLQNPLTITLSGNVSSLTQGQNMTVSASCSEAPDSYQWYLNGDPVSGATASTITIGSALPPGNYLLNVLATKDVDISSEGVSFIVTPASAVATPNVDVAEIRA